jgi:hypothetical protein
MKELFKKLSVHVAMNVIDSMRNDDVVAHILFSFSDVFS